MGTELEEVKKLECWNCGKEFGDPRDARNFIDWMNHECSVNTRGDTKCIPYEEEYGK